MPLSRTVPPTSSPPDAVRQALIGSFYAAHRPELADLVAAADLILEFPGLWLHLADPSVSAAWLEGKLLEAAAERALPLAWIRVLAQSGQSREDEA